MKTSTQFINTLEKINFVKFEDNKLTADNGLELSYVVRLNSGGHLPSAQIVAIVRYGGRVVQSWGFDDEASQLLFVKFWKRQEYNADNTHAERQEAIANIGRALFQSLNDEF